MRFLFLLTFFLTLFATSLSAEQEEILQYDIDITVRKNGMLSIDETIQVRALGNKIRRGIYRDFPTSYKDRFKNKVNVVFSVLNVQRDGETESYHLKDMSNGVRIYVGEKDQYLSSGVYTYTLSYKTGRQLGYFENHDELYFNAIGHGWELPIQQATVRVHLPQGISSQGIRYEAYTGSFGSRDRNYSASVIGNTVEFQLTEPLMRRQGMTVVVGWPKGLVKQPDLFDELQWFLSDNFDFLIFLLGVIGICFYYLRAWKKVGRDPDEGTIIPMFEPPENMSPATMRYLRERALDFDGLTAAIISLAVKGYLNIVQLGKPEINVTGAGQGELSPEEQSLLNELNARGGSVSFEQENYSDVQALKKALQKPLEMSHEQKHFIRNEGYAFFGWAISFGLFFVCLIFFAAIGFDFIRLINIVLAVLLLLLNIMMLYLLEAPTRKGQLLLDKIDGFQMYLETAEKETLGLINLPEETIDLFERYLPYAIALGVEHEWSERFSEQIEAAAKMAGSSSYRPDWYRGHSFRNSRDISRSLGSSFSSAISSASSPPGSSSGFSGGGGGGSSGGGGGGGGGGGW